MTINMVAIWLATAVASATPEAAIRVAQAGLADHDFCYSPLTDTERAELRLGEPYQYAFIHHDQIADIAKGGMVDPRDVALEIHYHFPVLSGDRCVAVFWVSRHPDTGDYIIGGCTPGTNRSACRANDVRTRFKLTPQHTLIEYRIHGPGITDYLVETPAGSLYVIAEGEFIVSKEERSKLWAEWARQHEDQ